MYYKVKFDYLNILIKAIIELNNKLYKLAIKIYYSNTNSKVRPYYEYINYCNRKI